ncbi:replicative DNA helicase [Microbacterium sp. YY-01]|uniref:replicative DNA helicase n=1 Tax=Microbacterium sp. YY-01 TaxID=3421634 RepID=UPI003D16A808
MVSDAEQSVLGAIMLSRNAMIEVAEILLPADFGAPMHETIFAAALQLLDADAPTDVVAVTDALIKTGELTGNLTAEYLHQLTDTVPTAANAGYYAKIVESAAIRRRVRAGIDKATGVVADETIPAEDIVEMVRAAFDDVDAATSRGVESIGDWYMDFLTSLEEKPSYTPTPWYDLNQMIFGVRDGGMYVIAAATGGGKSVMAIQIGAALAQRRPVLYVSLEMDRTEVAGRLAAATGQVFLGAINRHQLGKTEWEALAKHRPTIETLPLVIVGSDEVSTIPQLKAKVRATARRYKRNPVVIVDYLQLLTSHERVENRQQEVAGFSRALKLAAQQWRVPVIALSQLRRPQSGPKKAQPPSMHDLRESGQIENDSDVILLLDRKPVAGAADELKVIVAKNRQGQTGEVGLVFQGQFARVLSKYQVNEHIDFGRKAS